ncbi:MAG: exodeoxyribonuclease VII small subunit [Bacillota bacterium]
MATKKKQTFEESLLALEQIVETLEQEELPLEKAVSLYKEGAKLSAICQEKLLQIEGEIIILQGDGDDLKQSNFIEEEDHE